MIYRVLADFVLVLHAGYVAFVILGLLLTVLGAAMGWRWVRNRIFRALHLAAIGLVVLQAWLGIVCPLTTLENVLREKAGQTTYASGFVSHWVGAALFWDAPAWVFTLAYTLFGGLVLVTLWWAPVQWRKPRWCANP